MTIIFVDTGATAYFNVPNDEHIKISEIIDREIKVEYKQKKYWQPYNFFVFNDAEKYFKIDEHENPLNTVSVTTPCIVFSAYTLDKNKKIKSSGVFHSRGDVLTESFQERFNKLIDIVKTKSDEVIIKGTGGYFKEKNSKIVRSAVDELLSKKDLEMNPEKLLLGGGKFRITEFYPLNGQLITYFTGDKEKTIVASIKISFLAKAFLSANHLLFSNEPFSRLFYHL